jgi:chromosome segregation ATPase
VVIHKTTTSSSPETNVAQLQQDITTLGTRYEFLHQEALESTKGRRRLEEEQGEWVLEKSRLQEELEVLQRREEQLERLHAAEKNKCATLAQELADVTMELTLWDEALKEIQKDLQVQKEHSEMFMSFVDDETKKVDIHKLLQEIEQLQQRISDYDVDCVVDSVLNDILDNDSIEMEQRPSGQEVTNPRRFGLALLGGTLENLLDSDSLLLPNFPTQDYMPLSEVAEVAVPMPRS